MINFCVTLTADSLKLAISAKDDEIAMLRLQLQHLDADKSLLDGLSTQLDTKDSVSKVPF